VLLLLRLLVLLLLLLLLLLRLLVLLLLRLLLKVLPAACCGVFSCIWDGVHLQQQQGGKGGSGCGKIPLPAPRAVGHPI
jgi:hypothetical protein